jgi:hypothetical protein
MSKFEESRIQEAIVKRFNELVFYKQFNKLCFLYSNRNENKGIISGARYKKQGRLAGVPDLTLVCQGMLAYIEVKTPRAHRTPKSIERKSRGMSQDQIEFHDKYIQPMDIPFAVVSSVKEFEDFIKILSK